MDGDKSDKDQPSTTQTLESTSAAAAFSSPTAAMNMMMMMVQDSSFAALPTAASTSSRLFESNRKSVGTSLFEEFSCPSSSAFDDLLQDMIAADSLISPLVHDHHRPFPSPASEVVNTPATPNSSNYSISSSSTEAAAAGINDEDRKIKTAGEGEDHEEEEEGGGNDNNRDKTKKQLLKPKKKNTKRAREPRFAFMTKSEVDHLDDGYRWRKYGQKAVKNSPFPRSYYRCTSTACGVKKRVERSCEDPSIVVTTYEGTHTHPCPITPRGTFGSIMAETAAFGGSGGGGGGRIRGGVGSSSSFLMPHQMLHYHHQQQQQQPYFHNFTSPLSFSNNTITSNNLTFPPPFHERPAFRPSSSSSNSSARDHGLLQDMLPSKMLKEPKEED